MPVEIKELVIRAVTNIASEEEKDLAPTESCVNDKEAIIQDCVKQVLKILERKRER